MQQKSLTIGPVCIQKYGLAIHPQLLLFQHWQLC